ncbi:acyl-CoA dehydrogenase [Inquilinus ginsengisoli]|uniref:acyl-CoA dehydrogenase family protein n=1 Tax=Inquilinus ginsengisoli TaxID=363840 RepID=UPI003D1BA73A
MDRIETRPLALPPAIRGLNLFTTDRDLQRRLARRSPDLLPRFGDRLSEFGGWVGDAVEAQADYTSRHAPPRLESHDGTGAPAGRVVLNAEYRACHADAYRRGVVGLAFGSEGGGPERAPHLLSFVMGGVLSQADVSLHCPVTLTGAVAWALDRLAPDPVRSQWLPQLTRMDGQALSGGTWATELHGGTDVAATTTVAEPDGAAWRLTGLKWFTSNAGAGLALATARPRGAPDGARGLGCYLVPSMLPDGTPNRLHVRRLKDKVGTRGLATGETVLDGAWAVEVAPPPHGLKAMLEALEYSRVHNAFGAAGMHRRAVLEALAWTSHRRVGGTLLRATPMMRDSLLDLAATQEASAALAFEAAMAFEAPGEEPAVEGWRRAAVALAKYWTAAEATAAAAQAVEIVGGNGYTEEWPTARLYRDALVTAVWEGPANVQALEFLRATIGKLPGDQALLDRISGILDAAPGALQPIAARLRPLLDGCRAGFAHLRARPEDGPRLARRLMHPAAELLAACLMLEEAAADLAEGDRRKALMAGRFALRLDPHGMVDLAEDPLHALFDDIIGYGLCPA